MNNNLDLYFSFYIKMHYYYEIIYINEYYFVKSKEIKYMQYFI